MKWTCCQCGFPYEYDEGDTEERMCFDCLYENCDEDYEDYVQNLNKDAKIGSQMWDLFSIIATGLVAYYFWSHLW